MKNKKKFNGGYRKGRDDVLADVRKLARELKREIKSDALMESRYFAGKYMANESHLVEIRHVINKHTEDS